MPGDCCTANAAANCNDGTCAGCVCDFDPYCCTTQWDELCAIEARDPCAPSCSCALGTVTPGPAPTTTPTPTDTPSPTPAPTVVDSCPLVDLGQALPVSVTGSTAGVSNAMGGASCGDGGANAADVTYLWTAPADGTYAIGTLGSAFNTILSERRIGSAAIARFRAIIDTESHARWRRHSDARRRQLPELHTGPSCGASG